MIKISPTDEQTRYEVYYNKLCLGSILTDIDNQKYFQQSPMITGISTKNLREIVKKMLSL